MPKKDYYLLEKNINKILRNEPTNFIDPGTLKKIIPKLKGIKYNIYYPYKDSDKVIIYINNIPRIRFLEIISYNPLSHREILGSLYGLNIDSELFGDIIITNNHYYIMVIDSIYNLVINELNMIGKNKIKLKEVDINILNNYERQYEEIELIVSSLRIDNVISSIIGTSRDKIKEKFLNDDIILNYEIYHKYNYLLKELDVFSIRKYGKYKYLGILKETKKENNLIKCLKYIDK